MSKPDLEALVTPKISEAILAAVGQVGEKEFLAIAGIDKYTLQELGKDQGVYVPVALITLACQINRSHSDPNIAHSSVAECLKGSTIRMQQLSVKPGRGEDPSSDARRPLRRPPTSGRSYGGLYGKRSVRVAGFTANIVALIVLGYFLGGIGLSPLLGQASCIGVSFSPTSLVPCSGSLIGIVLGVVGGLGYTYYYFVKKM